MPEEKYLSLLDEKTFTLPKNLFDDYKNKNAAASHEMGIYEDMDIVYDLKTLDKEGEFQTKYRNNAHIMYDRMNEEQRESWDAYYNPIIEKFKKNTLKGKELALWKYNRYMKDYLSTIQSVDDGVGELLEYLDKTDYQRILL